MRHIIDALRKKPDLIHGDGCTKEQIDATQKALNLTFAEDYREYLQTYALVAYDGHELTGITQTPRLNVVSATKSEREYNDKIPDDMYVVEITGMDGLVIWQKNSGEIYYSQLDSAPIKKHDNLVEFVESY